MVIVLHNSLYILVEECLPSTSFPDNQEYEGVQNTGLTLLN